MNTKFGREIKKGDFIIIASDHRLELGFFIDETPLGNVRYCTFFDLVNWNMLKSSPLHINHIHPYKDNEDYCKIARYSPGLLNKEYLELYDNSIEILKLLKIRE